MAQNAAPPSLKEQLEAQYKLSKVHANGSVDAGTVLVVQLAGIQGEPQGDFAIAPAVFKDGLLKPPSGKSNFGAAIFQATARPGSDTSGHEFRPLPVGDKVYVSKLDVNLKYDRVVFVIYECGACNGVDQSSEYKAAVSFQFAKGYLASASVPDVEDTIAKVFAIDTGSAQGEVPPPAEPRAQQAPQPELSVQPAPAQPVGAAPLTNDDIIKLTQVKLGNDVIIGKIRSSTCAFDTSADALIKLKQAGVSDTVLQAMIAGGGAPPTSIAGQPPSSVAGGPLPTAYGYYVVADGQPLSVKTVPISVVAGLRFQDSLIAVDGVAGEPNIRVRSSLPTFIIYQQSIDIQNIHFSSLTFVSSMHAYEFNMLNTKPEFFPGYYGRNYNERIPISLWRPQSDITFTTEPIEGKSGMFRLTPTGPLQPGRYVSYFSQNIHPNGTIFATKEKAPAQALYFEVVGGNR
jgi:hypothetical protein